MADEEILRAARELAERSDNADDDVRKELALMTASVATAQTTLRAIGESDATTQRHGDEMARQIAADLRAAEAVLEWHGSSDRLAAATLEGAEKNRFSIVSAMAPERPFVVPPLASPRNEQGRINETALPEPSQYWTSLAKPLDLVEVLARAATDTAAIAVEKPAVARVEQPQIDRTPRTKETT